MVRYSLLMASKCDSELSLPQECVKYVDVVVGDPEAVGGTSPSYDVVYLWHDPKCRSCNLPCVLHVVSG